MKTLATQEGLYFELDFETYEASVVFNESYKNLTNIKIPDTVTHENIIFKVTSIGKGNFLNKKNK